MTVSEEWRSHWPLVVAGALGFSLASIAMMSLGAFMAPLEQAFGWPRAQISAGLAISAVVSIVLSPLVGNLVDRWGPRRIAVPGVVLCGVTFALFGTVTNSIVHWLLLWLLFALATQLTKTVVWTAAISSEFTASRGLALAVTLAGSGLGSVLSPIFANFVIDEFGWRLGYAVMGLSWGGVVGLFCYFFFYGQADRVRGLPVARHAPRPSLTGVSAREGLRSGTFAKLAGAAFFGNMLIVGATIHLIPLLSSTGLSRADATWVAGASIGIGSVTGKLICGVLVDRVPGNVIAAVFLALPIVMCLMLLAPSESVTMRLIPLAAFGLSVGAQVHMLAYLSTRYFGLRAFGTIFGFLGSIIAAAVGIGPVLTGYVYDHTRSYDAVLIAGIPISIVAVLLMLSLGRYPDFSNPVETSAHDSHASARLAV